MNMMRGFSKLNVDASFHVDLYSGATGAVIRDDTGAFIACSNCGYHLLLMLLLLSRKIYVVHAKKNLGIRTPSLGFYLLRRRTGAP
jgi:hypothetical protein